MAKNFGDHTHFSYHGVGGTRRLHYLDRLDSYQWDPPWTVETWKSTEHLYEVVQVSSGVGWCSSMETDSDFDIRGYLVYKKFLDEGGERKSQGVRDECAWMKQVIYGWANNVKSRPTLQAHYGFGLIFRRVLRCEVVDSMLWRPIG